MDGLALLGCSSDVGVALTDRSTLGGLATSVVVGILVQFTLLRDNYICHGILQVSKVGYLRHVCVRSLGLGASLTAA